MPCCQVCVFAFTAFLIVAERTARKSQTYLGHTRTHRHTRVYTHVYFCVLDDNDDDDEDDDAQGQIFFEAF